MNTWRQGKEISEGDCRLNAILYPRSPQQRLAVLTLKQEVCSRTDQAVQTLPQAVEQLVAPSAERQSALVN